MRTTRSRCMCGWLAVRLAPKIATTCIAPRGASARSWGPLPLGGTRKDGTPAQAMHAVGLGARKRKKETGKRRKRGTQKKKKDTHTHTQSKDGGAAPWHARRMGKCARLRAGEKDRGCTHTRACLSGWAGERVRWLAWAVPAASKGTPRAAVEAGRGGREGRRGERPAPRDEKSSSTMPFELASMGRPAGRPASSTSSS